MNGDNKTGKSTLIYVAQVLSLSLNWIFVLLLTIWIIHLIRKALELNDAPGASIAISIVAIPVFITLAGVLTYVFFGLHREQKKNGRQ